VSEVLFQARTAFQDLLLLDTPEYGKMLVIDGETQSAQEDEYIYHEALVQPAMLAHPGPRSALIIGGGEGATLREVLRHDSIERATMVDIDGELVGIARQQLREWHQGAFDDPRARVVIRDALAWLDESREQFDVVIVDLCDYVEGTAAAPLYDDVFFRRVAGALARGGILVVQAGELGRWSCDGHAGLARMIERTLGPTESYSTFVESFWSEWSFLLAGALPAGLASSEASVIDARIASAGLTSRMRFYDGATHQRMFHLPKDIRDALRAARAA
jgi:spermidine synthase